MVGGFFLEITMSKLYRNKNSGNIWPEFKGTENQANYPKTWEEVDAEGNLVVAKEGDQEPYELVPKKAAIPHKKK
jgi:hypothetical protein